jgi:hypothetical protein
MKKIICCVSSSLADLWELTELLFFFLSQLFLLSCSSSNCQYAFNQTSICPLLTWYSVSNTRMIVIPPAFYDIEVFINWIKLETFS